MADDGGIFSTSPLTAAKARLASEGWCVIERVLDPERSAGVLARLWDAAREFEDYRKLFPAAAWPPITALEDICSEKRQLDHQVRLHHWLHGWLLVHLPVSAALLLLAFIHAVVALRY